MIFTLFRWKYKSEVFGLWLVNVRYKKYKVESRKCKCKVYLNYMCHMVFKVYTLWKSCFTLKTGICLYKNFLAYKVFEVTDLCKSCFALAVEWLLHSVGAQMYFYITFLWKFCTTHLYGFSLVCICSFIPLFCEHLAAHLSQVYGFSPVCLTLWYSTLLFCENLVHIHDICTAYPQYENECVLLGFRSVKTPQSWHIYDFFQVWVRIHF